MDTQHLSSPHMAFIMDVSPIACVDIVFVDAKKERTLLFLRSNEPCKGQYFTIGGRIWKGESFFETAKRKAHEELALSIDRARLIGPHVTEDIHQNSAFRDVSYHAVPIFFFYTLNVEEERHINLDTQHEHAKWFPIRCSKLHPLIKNRLAYLEMHHE